MLIPDPEMGGYEVKVPALPECSSEGDTREEAIANARQAIALYLDELIANGEPIPEEPAPWELAWVEVPEPSKP